MIGALTMVALVATGGGSDRDALRALFTEVMREGDAGKREAIAERADEIAEGMSIDDVAEVVGEGPHVPPGKPKAREVGGKLEELETFGSVMTGFSFEFGKRTLRYAVDVPPGYDGKKRVGLLLDPGHGSGAKSDAEGKAGFLAMFRRHADAAGLKDWLVARTEIVEQVGTGGLDGELPEDEVAAAFDAFFRDVAGRFAVDCDRVVVNGLSQTGFWSWYLGRTNPDRWAAVLPMSAVTWEVDAYAANFLNARVGVLHGSEDPVCPVGQARGTVALLQRLGVDVRYVEVPGAKHEYAVWGKAPAMLRELAEAPRVRFPRLRSFSLQTLRQPWSGSVRVEEIEKEGDGKAGTAPTAGVDVRIEGQRVELFSSGVRRLALVLAEGEVKLGEPVVVIWNGKKVHEGRVEPRASTIVWAAAETCCWTAGRSARLDLRAP